MWNRSVPTNDSRFFPARTVDSDLHNFTAQLFFVSTTNRPFSSRGPPRLAQNCSASVTNTMQSFRLSLQPNAHSNRLQYQCGALFCLMYVKPSQYCTRSMHRHNVTSERNMSFVGKSLPAPTSQKNVTVLLHTRIVAGRRNFRKFSTLVNPLVVPGSAPSQVSLLSPDLGALLYFLNSSMRIR